MVFFTGVFDQDLEKPTVQQVVDMFWSKKEITPPELTQDLARKPLPETKLTAFLPLLSQLQQQCQNTYAPLNPFNNKSLIQQIQ
ncbi:MAG: hypothetical protein EZS28_040330 [Streblomastix strix]|uniref:Uncharacterized protein n=1 Tax=Streblomastix strix TaxID=222440 RepID=A0A5J4U3C2_9EUKA|nr:MAG: hypothetical protein EZS28_040330 [Streblomastix strix]